MENEKYLSRQPSPRVWLKLGIQVAFIKQSKTQDEIGRWYIWQHNKGIMSPRLCKYNMEKY